MSTSREGLTFAQGRLFESIGLYHHSQLRELDPETGVVVGNILMDGKYFGEGLTYVDGKLIQLTYRRNTGFVYDFNNLEAPPATFKFHTQTNEGWGMTYNPNRREIIVSDGSDHVFFWDPTNFTEIRRMQVVRQFGKESSQINELEFWRDRYVQNP